jgi:CheY-like chemotaxis protein
MASVVTPASAVLVVEDDDDYRAALGRMLAQAGYAVQAVAGGREALDYLRIRPPPSLILLELMLSDLSCQEFQDRLRADLRLSHVPVVIVCAPGREAPSAGPGPQPASPPEAELLSAVEHFARPLGVLVVDDEAGVVGMVVAALHHFGLTAYHAGSGREGLRVYQEHQDTIDVVLLDVQMPGLDGPQTLAALRALNPEVRILFMSGDTGRYSREELMALPASGVLEKPFARLADLVVALRQAAARPPA